MPNQLELRKPVFIEKVAAGAFRERELEKSFVQHLAENVFVNGPRCTPRTVAVITLPGVSGTPQIEQHVSRPCIEANHRAFAWEISDIGNATDIENDAVGAGA